MGNVMPLQAVKPRKTIRHPAAGYLLAMQLRLLQRALASWARRNAPLLYVNCGSGQFLQFLWQGGFEVAATEGDPDLRQIAATLPLRGLEIFAAQEDHLPFDEDAFDWVIIHLKNSSPITPDACIKEGLRVAKRGLLLTFWNSSSIPAIFNFRRHGNSVLHGAYSWYRIWRTMLSLGSGNISFSSTFFSPEKFWRKSTANNVLNKVFSFLPLGGWCVIRLDLKPLHPVTPLAMRIERKLGNPSPAMEYSQETLTKHRQDL